MQLAEGRLAPACGASLHHAGYHTAYRIAVGLDLAYEAVHAARHPGIGASHIVGLGLREVVVGIGAGQDDVSHLLCISLHGDTQLAEHHLGKGSPHHAADGLACRAAPSAAMVTQSVLLGISIVGMAGAEQGAHVIVVLTVLIAVAHYESNGAARGALLEDTAEQLHSVGLLTCRGECALAWPAAVQFALYEIHIYGDSRRDAVYHAPYGRSVALSECGETEDVAKCVHFCVLLACMG